MRFGGDRRPKNSDPRKHATGEFGTRDSATGSVSSRFALPQPCEVAPDWDRWATVWPQRRAAFVAILRAVEVFCFAPSQVIIVVKKANHFSAKRTCRANASYQRTNRHRSTNA